jgi:hypothetical protein
VLSILVENQIKARVTAPVVWRVFNLVTNHVNNLVKQSFYDKEEIIFLRKAHVQECAYFRAVKNDRPRMQEDANSALPDFFLQRWSGNGDHFGQGSQVAKVLNGIHLFKMEERHFPIKSSRLVKTKNIQTKEIL